MLLNKDQYMEVQRAVGSAINHMDLQDDLADYDVEVNETYYGQFGTITVSGGEDETAFEVVLKVVSVQIGFDTTIINHDKTLSTVEEEGDEDAAEFHSAGIPLDKPTSEERYAGNEE